MPACSSVPEAEIPARVDEMVARFGLGEVLDALPDNLPLGIRQRLSLAVAMVHKPELLILDEPTSGVDPIARDSFWQLMIDLARNDQVTIFISTHFMNEAERCDRISLMHAGQGAGQRRPGRTGAPSAARPRWRRPSSATWKTPAREASRRRRPPATPDASGPRPAASPERPPHRAFSLARAFSYSLRETLELQRDPVRATMALLGTR